ncbi:MAG: DMT family transporter [Chitinophagaceae bacterium]
MTERRSYQLFSWAGILLTVFGAIFFSTKAVIVKYAFSHTRVDAVSLLALRMLFSLPFYLGAAWLSSNRKGNTRLTGRQWLSVVVLGLFGYYLSSLFDFLGLQYISAGLERLILFLYPTFVVLINAALFKEKISGLQKIALLLTFAGIAMAYIGELEIDTGNPDFYLGSALIFCCAITYAIYIAGSGRVIPVTGSVKFTAYSMLASTAGVFLHFIAAGHYAIIGSSTGFIWYGLLLAIVATVIPTFLIAQGMKKIGANNVAIISAIGPVSTILQAHFVLDEPIFAAQIAGTATVVAGVILIGWNATGKDHPKAGPRE